MITLSSQILTSSLDLSPIVTVITRYIPGGFHAGQQQPQI